MTLDDWKSQSSLRQKIFLLSLGNRIWEMYKLPDDEQHLWQKIAIALSGQPRSTAEDFGLSDDQKQMVDEIKSKCVKYSQEVFQDVYIAVIFTCVYREGTIDTVVPVFRVRRDTEEVLDVSKSYFIDHVGRVYHSWNNYLEENIWNVCWICVPEGGVYIKGNVDCPQFYDQTHRGDLTEFLDKMDNVLKTSSSLGMLTGIGMTLFPQTAVIGAVVILGSIFVKTTRAVYDTGRGIEILTDRFKHDQSLGLDNAEARMCWLNIIKSIIAITGIDPEKALSHAGVFGITVSEEIRSVCIGLDMAVLSTCGLNILSYANDLGKRGELTALEALQFTTCVFFLTHSDISFETASDIIAESKEKYFEKINSNKFPDIEDSDGRQEKKELSNDTWEVRTSHRRVEYVKKIKKIRNAEEFMSEFEARPEGQ
ncbi:uncharacterized protein pst [Palaemon carinicauda]|uniref:uncharacterized protein pst n=1 Tax=Palaemon carinicauda TaxID=392227 RepID=UPI0035B645D2